MKQPLVSILICTYNAESTIKETLESCINQTYGNFEVLIHDDWSKDKTINVINSIWDNRVKIIESWKKLWPYKGLNFLLNHAKGKYIAIQDHDDLWYTTKIEKQVKLLEKNKEFIWYWTRTMIWYEWDNKGYEYYLWDSCYFTIHPSLVFRNEWFRYDDNRVYMWDAYFQKKKLCNWEKKIGNIDEVLTIHRIKKWADNYTYKWFRPTKTNLSTLFYIYSPIWWICVLCFEFIRKLIYPIFHLLKKWRYIDKIERFPFVLRRYDIKDINKEGFKLLK